MAQGSKSRIVIWVIVGILVVLAAVMLITKPKATGKPPVNATKFVNAMNAKLGRLETKVALVRPNFPDAPAEKWQQIADGIATVRQLLAEMPGITDNKDLQVKADSANKAFLGVRKVYKEITGKNAPSDSTGGQ